MIKYVPDGGGKTIDHEVYHYEVSTRCTTTEVSTRCTTTR